jgi:hypothetical protein
VTVVQAICEIVKIMGPGKEEIHSLRVPRHRVCLSNADRLMCDVFPGKTMVVRMNVAEVRG